MEFGKKGFRKVEMFISAQNCTPEDYLHLPVIKDGKAIGVVSEAYFENWVGVKLTLTLWVDLEWEAISGKLSAIIFE